MITDVFAILGNPVGDRPLFELTDDVRPVRGISGVPRGGGAQMLVTERRASGGLARAHSDSEVASIKSRKRLAPQR